jgi:hypothetical protein
VAAGYLYVVLHGHTVAFIVPWWVVSTPDPNAWTGQAVVLANGSAPPITPGGPPHPFVVVRPIDGEGHLWPCDGLHHPARPWCAECTQNWIVDQVVVKEPYETFRSVRRPEWGTGVRH